MTIKKVGICPLTLYNNIEETYCYKEGCAWWNSKQKACSVAVLVDIMVDAYEEVCGKNA